MCYNYVELSSAAEIKAMRENNVDFSHQHDDTESSISQLSLNERANLLVGKK
jgi:hypothetical protein